MQVYFFFIKLSTKTYLTGVCYDLNDTEGELRVRQMGCMFCDLHVSLPGRVAQSVTCLATDACLTADPGVASSIPARSHTFVEIDHEIISTVISSLPLIYSRRVVVSYKRKYVHKLLVNRLFKPAQEKLWLSELTVPQ